MRLSYEQAFKLSELLEDFIVSVIETRLKGCGGLADARISLVDNLQGLDLIGLTIEEARQLRPDFNIIDQDYKINWEPIDNLDRPEDRRPHLTVEVSGSMIVDILQYPTFGV